MKVSQKQILISSGLTVAALVFTLMVAMVDVRAIGPENGMVGFASINDAFFKSFGYNKVLHFISEYAGYIPAIAACVFAFIGLKQAITRKSIFKIDKAFWALAVFYLSVGVVYVLFEKLAINCRPTIIDGEIEASYPSSHSLLSVCLCASTIIFNNFYYKKNQIAKYANIACYILCPLIVFGRLFSGVHWLTDILGGVLIGACLVMWFSTILYRIRQAKSSK